MFSVWGRGSAGREIFFFIYIFYFFFFIFFFFNDTATTEIYTLSLHDALPICHTYADDTQFWVSFDEAGEFNNEATARWRISQAFGIISKFMLENHLKLNPKKTQFIPFSRKTDAIDFAPLALSREIGRAHV